MLLFRESVRGKWLKRKGQRRGRKAISGEISWYQTQQVHRSQKRSSSYLPTAQPLVPHAGAASAQWWRVWGIAWRGTKSKGGLSCEEMRMKSQQIFNKSQDERTLQKGVSRKNSAGKTGHPYAENETISYLSPYTKLNQKKKKRIKDNKCKTWNYPTIWGKHGEMLQDTGMGKNFLTMIPKGQEQKGKLTMMIPSNQKVFARHRKLSTEWRDSLHNVRNRLQNTHLTRDDKELNSRGEKANNLKMPRWFESLKKIYKWQASVRKCSISQIIREM